MATGVAHRGVSGAGFVARIRRHGCMCLRIPADSRCPRTPYKRAAAARRRLSRPAAGEAHGPPHKALSPRRDYGRAAQRAAQGVAEASLPGGDIMPAIIDDLI